jgi:hypothetical protein
MRSAKLVLDGWHAKNYTMNLGGGTPRRGRESYA